MKDKGFISIKDVDQLEKVTNCSVPDKNRPDIQKVIEKYPVRLSKHVISQIKTSENIAYQYMPFVEELDTKGHTNTWVGQFQDGLLEQMYPNRVIFLLNMTCPVYCRFCFRKHKDSRNEKNPTIGDIKKALEHVKNSPLIKEILITGGDPFLNISNLNVTIDGLMQINHVQTLRLATRSISFYPDLFLQKNKNLLYFLKKKNRKLLQRGKRIEIATHFIHPDEISTQSLEIITNLVKNGIAVYIQTPFLNNCNDKGPELVKLFSILRGAGAELHYIFIPCSPIRGNSLYWSPMSKGINIASHLRAHVSDRAIPRICTATPIGKIDWYSSGWAVEKVKGKDDFIWIRTPYTKEFFKKFAPLASSFDNIRVNDEGTLDIQYMAKIGEECHFIGSRSSNKSNINIKANKKDIKSLISKLKNQKQFGHSIVKTNLKNLIRLHETRVQIDIKAQGREFDYIESNAMITDVIIVSDGDVMDSLDYIEKIINRLKNIPHINSVRLLSRKFNYSPESFTKDIIKKLSDLNNISIQNPLRLEIETWFTMHDEISDIHANLANRLNNKGITVYCNCPLLGSVNDNPDEILKLAYSLRKASIEFHHLYIAGLPIQEKWNNKHPIDSNNVIDIASKVRRHGSGREIPRYIILTSLGEVDYGLTSSFVYNNNELRLKLDCYKLLDFQSMDPNFLFSNDVLIDNGKPLVNISGFNKSKDFPI
ncbi:MAG: radical SAM protein [Desulfobacteraceae bacterium]|nr:radical SAM protein [Desulfobacteraceae bacterium]